jgi:hypothetical protein
MDVRKWIPFIISFVKLVNDSIMLRGYHWIDFCRSAILKLY